MEQDPNQQPNQQPDAATSPVPPTTPEPHHETRRERRKRKKIIIFVSVGVALALLILGLVYWLFLANGNEKNPEETVAASQNQDQSNDTQTPAVADPTPTTFKSTKLNIELTHRKDWTLKESGDGFLTITSPSTSYSSSDGTSKTGVFTVRIRKGASTAQQATIDKSIATRNSEVIAYAEPAEGQRKYTNLSFAGPKDMFGFFIVTSNTEFKAGASLAYALQFNTDSYFIVGGYGADVANSLAFDSVPKDLMDSDTLTQAIDIVESLKIF